jgi:hypothetical protein
MTGHIVIDAHKHICIVPRHVFLGRHGIVREREVHARNRFFRLRGVKTQRAHQRAVRLACLWTSAFRPRLAAVTRALNFPRIAHCGATPR